MNINAPVGGRAFALPFTRAADPNVELTEKEMRLPLAHKVPDYLRNHFIAMCGEYVGTVLFLFFALSGTQVANNIPSSSGLTVAQTGSNPQQSQYIALCFGFSLAVNAWVFFRISGGSFNPAVTFGMCLIGALPWVRGVLLFVTQILGGLTAAALVSCMFPGALTVTTALGGNTSVVQGLFIEMFSTAQLVFTIFMLAAEKHKGTFIAPVGIGLSLFIAELTGVYFTGGSLNPARSFGPAVVIHSFHGYHWIYWVGPILGSIVAAGFYKFIKILEYETANPDQDSSHAAKMSQKKEHSLAAGSNEVDAHDIAIYSAKQQSVGEMGGVNGSIFANGQGRKFQEADAQGMYGTDFRRSTTGNSEGTLVQAPAAAGTLAPNAVERFQQREGIPRQNSGSGSGRVESPGMASHDDIYAPLQDGRSEALGHMVRHEPRSRFARTESSGV